MPTSISNNPSYRAILGKTVPIEVFRILRLNGIEPLFGSGSNAITIQCGRDLGKKLGATLLSKCSTYETYLSQVVGYFKDNSIGIVSLRQENSDLFVQVDECVSCSGLPNMGKCICGFEGGIIAGLFQAYYQKIFYVKEVKCWAKGDQTCLFNVKDMKEM